MNIQRIMSKVIIIGFMSVSVAYADDIASLDSQIATNVSMQIAADAALQGLNIVATCQNGVVTLDGVVYSQNQVNEAVIDAQGVAGVQNVVSTIAIDTSGQ